jgi:hypothetical protein
MRGSSRNLSIFSWVSKQPIPPTARVLEGKDPYAWIRNGNEREIKSYLESENRYAKNILRKTKSFEELLYNEMAARVPANEDGLPERIQNWLYYVRTEEGGNGFPIYCRRPLGSDETREEIVLDQNSLARNKPYLSVPQCKFSLCHSMLAFTADTTGAERYNGYIKDLRTGRIVVSFAAPAFPLALRPAESVSISAASPCAPIARPLRRGSCIAAAAAGRDRGRRLARVGRRRPHALLHRPRPPPPPAPRLPPPRRRPSGPRRAPRADGGGPGARSPLIWPGRAAPWTGPAPPGSDRIIHGSTRLSPARAICSGPFRPSRACAGPA